jgi:UDP:flavonoid glycosyltransferase YjiC (YdhE family)
MRLLMHTGSASGHLRPALPIARAWRDRGHEVVVATGAAARDETEGLGFDFIELPAVAGVGGQSLRRELEDMDGAQRTQAVLGMFFEMAMALTKPLADVAQNWKPDVILGESTSWAVLFAGELTAIPAATFGFNPIDARFLTELLGDQFAAFRSELGLPADPELAALNRWLTLVGGPPE